MNPGAIVFLCRAGGIRTHDLSSPSSQITLVEGGTTAGSWAALVDTSQLVVGERRPATLEVSRDYGFATDTIGIRATWRGGLAVLNPEAISLVTDIR